MRRFVKWILAGVLIPALLLTGGVLALQRWIGTADFRARLEREAAAALGVTVKLERIDVVLWPLPALVLEGLQIQTRPALSIERVDVRPVWMDLLQGRAAPATLIVRQAVLPQPGIDALLAAWQKGKRTAPENKNPNANQAMALLPKRIVLDGLTWSDAQGAAMTLAAEASLGHDALPQELTLQVLKGRLSGTRLALQRDGNAWDVRLQVGGGTVKGRIELQPAAEPGAEFALKGRLQTRDVEVSALTAAESSARTQAAQPLSGRIEGTTQLALRTRKLATVADVLQTQSQFTVQKAVLHGMDLTKAVKTVGISRGGETRLDTLAGQVTTRGRAIELTHLVASSGAMSATGNLSIAPGKTLSGRISVELSGAVGVPLVVGGTVAEPSVTLTRGAMIGAALGTVLMPGVGTGAGASAGDKVGEGLKKLFGN